MKKISLLLLSFIVFSFLGVSNLYADWEGKDSNHDSKDCRKGKYCLVVGVDDPELNFTHPVSGEPCTEDVYNVQNAVDNCKYVRLKGEFNFGHVVDDNWELLGDGVVTIRNPNVTVKGPATVKYGGGWWQFRVEAPGVKIQKLTLLEAMDVSIYIHVADEGKPVCIEGNTIKPAGDWNFGIEAWIEGMACPLKIRKNYIEFKEMAAIWVKTWDNFWPEDQQKNYPVLIENNKIHCIGEDAFGMLLGSLFYGLGNTIVKNNKIYGEGHHGISQTENTRRNKIVCNDFSGMQTWYSQIWTAGRGHTIAHNKFGNANALIPEWVDLEELWFMNTAVSVWNLNQGFWADIPQTWTRYNKIYGNDYTNCGLSGWTFDPDWDPDEWGTRPYLTTGCIVFADFPSLFDEEPGPWWGLGMEDNLVKEYNFPEGTTLCDQVWDIGGKNKVVGWDKFCDNGLAKPLAVLSESMPNFEVEKYKKLHTRHNRAKDYYHKYLAKDRDVDVQVQTLTTTDKFDLAQNYPNPFNPTTSITFDLPKASFVTLKVYNMLGEEVATLVSENLETGSHSYEFDGSNLASGIYLYKLETAQFQMMKKMILLK